MNKTLLAVLFAIFFLLSQPTYADQLKNAQVTIPVIGCSVDVQGSLVPAQKNNKKITQIDAKIVSQFAFYQLAQGSLEILAPRGWHCFGTEGSGGSTLYVTPDSTIKADDLFNSSWKGFTGPAIEARLTYNDGTSRSSYDIGPVIVCAFSTQQACVKKLKELIAKELIPADVFSSGHFPKDKIIYRKGNIAEYQTPPNSDGLGTMSDLRKNNSPISGVVINADDLMHVIVRLPPDMDDLKSNIIQQFERENIPN